MADEQTTTNRVRFYRAYFKALKEFHVTHPEMYSWDWTDEFGHRLAANMTLGIMNNRVILNTPAQKAAAKECGIKRFNMIALRTYLHADLPAEACNNSCVNIMQEAQCLNMEDVLNADDKFRTGDFGGCEETCNYGWSVGKYTDRNGVDFYIVNTYVDGPAVFLKL